MRVMRSWLGSVEQMALFPQAGATLSPTGYSVPAAAGLNWSHNGGARVEIWVSKNKHGLMYIA